MQKVIQHNKIMIRIFLLFFIFSVVGSNLYIVYTTVAFRNIFFVVIFIMLFFLYRTKLSPNQVIILTPLLLLYFLGFSMFFINGYYDIETFKDFFYFTFIPIQFIIILFLANKNNKYFFKQVYRVSFLLLVLLFFIVIFELLTGIHLPSYNSINVYLPAAFFSNPNDLSVIVISLYMLLMAIKINSNKKKDLLISLVAGFIILVTLSRGAFLVFIFLAISKFISTKYVKRIFILIAVGVGVLLAARQIKIPQQSDSLIDRSLIRINSIANFKTQKNIKGSSVNVRFDIYKIPFKHPKKFIFGNGFNSDKEIIQKYNGKNFAIINSHSFFIQVIFYFGWISFMLLMIFFITLIIYSINNKGSSNFLFLIVISQMIIINIPSSIMRMPVIWIPFFIIISYFTTKNKYA